MKATSYTINATAAEIVPKQHYERTIYVHAKNGDIHIGDSTVTAATGYPIKNGEALAIQVPINENIYAIDGAGGTAVVVLDSSAD